MAYHWFGSAIACVELELQSGLKEWDAVLAIQMGFLCTEDILFEFTDHESNQIWTASHKLGFLAKWDTGLCKAGVPSLDFLPHLSASLHDDPDLKFERSQLLANVIPDSSANAAVVSYSNTFACLNCLQIGIAVKALQKLLKVDYRKFMLKSLTPHWHEQILRWQTYMCWRWLIC